MSTLIKPQIKTKIAAIAFSDNSKVIDRSSEIIIKDKDIDKINESNQELIQNHQIIDQQNTILVNHSNDEYN